MLTFFSLSFFLVLQILQRTMYLVNLTIVGHGTFLLGLCFPKWYVLSIS